MEEEDLDKLKQDQSEVKAEEVEEEASQEVEREKPIEYRFVCLLKNQIRVDKKLEIQKEILFSNQQFIAIEAFRMFD